MKYKLAKKTVDDINILIHRFSRIQNGKLPLNLLKYIYDTPKTSFPKSTKAETTIPTLLEYGLITIDGSTYTITDYGKYVCLSKKLGIRFLSLCALSEIYVMQSLFSNPKNGSYVITRFLDKLEAVYSPITLRMVFVRLGIAGYICKRSSKKVYIPHSIYLKIKKHDLVLRSLQKWFANTCDKIDELIDADPNIVANIKKNVF